MSDPIIVPAQPSKLFRLLQQNGLGEVMLPRKRIVWRSIHGKVARNRELFWPEGSHLQQPISQAVLNSAVKAGVLAVDLDGDGKRYRPGRNWE